MNRRSVLPRSQSLKETLKVTIFARIFRHGLLRIPRRALVMVVLATYVFAGAMHGLCECDVTNPSGATNRLARGEGDRPFRQGSRRGQSLPRLLLCDRTAACLRGNARLHRDPHCGFPRCRTSQPAARDRSSPTQIPDLTVIAGRLAPGLRHSSGFHHVLEDRHAFRVRGCALRQFVADGGSSFANPHHGCCASTRARRQSASDCRRA